MKGTPTVSVITCSYTHERLSYLKEAIDAVLRQTLTPADVIVSVDHNPGLADTLERELPPVVRVVRNESVKGVSESRNLGVKAARGEILAFVDDDAVPDPDWLEQLTFPFQEDTVAAVGGRIDPVWMGNGRPSWFPEELDWIVGCTYKGLPVKNGRTRNVIGCNMAFRRSVFEEIGGFRPEVGRTTRINGVGEEAEICLRVAAARGCNEVVYQPQAVVRHKVHTWRLTLGYVWHRSKDEGFYKTRIPRLVHRSDEVLALEHTYLRYLVLRAIPSRLLAFYRRRSLQEASVLAVSIVAAGLGYVLGRTRNAWSRRASEVTAGEVL